MRKSLLFNRKEFAKGKRGLLDILEEVARARAGNRLCLDEDKNLIDAVLEGVGNALTLLDDAEQAADDHEPAKVTA